MKWEICDINIVEWANIPKFSKQDDIVTPFRLLELFFGYVLVDMIIGYTKLHSHREKTDIGFDIANEKVRLFLSMPLLSGCHKLPDRKMNWEATPVLLCKQGLVQYFIIHSSVFFGISIFVTANNLINKTKSPSSFA